ncbi:MAG: hypothetical protein JSR46_06000, partial [Verrucomicrobia bacterium]|nr:hypothetical protein [Verrucomicrobiota bacterium]
MTVTVFGENIHTNTVYVAGPFGFRKVVSDGHRTKYSTYKELVKCISVYTRSERKDDWIYKLDELETVTHRMYDLMKDYEVDRYVSFAFHLLARDYEKILPRTKTADKDV